jgi:hypothetical protein
MTQKIYWRICVGLGLVVVCGALGAARVEAGPGDRQSALAQKVLGPSEPASPRRRPPPETPPPICKRFSDSLWL